MKKLTNASVQLLLSAALMLMASVAIGQANMLNQEELSRKCVYGDCENGYGVMEFRTPIGTDRYEGNFENGMFHGYGKFEQMVSRSDRSYYDGEWNMGVREGRGTYWNGESNLYMGQWRDDKRHGHGSYFFGLTDWVPNRNTEAWLQENVENYTGEFVDDLYQGQGTYRWTNGQRYVGTFFANEKHGAGVFWYPRGTRREQFWEYGRFVR